MRVITRTIIPKLPSEVWNQLLNSNVDSTIYCPIFCLGVPRPVRCEYNIGDIAPERRRKCVSTKGTIEQQIDIFDPPKHLAFHLVETDLSIKACITSMSDDFILEPHTNGTNVTRTTEITLGGRLLSVKLPLMWIGIKSVHNHVYSAWKRQ